MWSIVKGNVITHFKKIYIREDKSRKRIFVQYSEYKNIRIRYFWKCEGLFSQLHYLLLKVRWTATITTTIWKSARWYRKKYFSYSEFIANLSLEQKSDQLPVGENCYSQLVSWKIQRHSANLSQNVHTNLSFRQNLSVHFFFLGITQLASSFFKFCDCFWSGSNCKRPFKNIPCHCIISQLELQHTCFMHLLCWSLSRTYTRTKCQMIRIL